MKGKQTNTGYPATGIECLTIAFIVLKLCHVISWSWWWVLAPVWIPAAIALVCGLVMLIAAKAEK
jgi:hypothetical protein